ncbi:hypothetical protein [Roseomonas chloroacetimidivorans]|uniref:hypothetical protein n=1 Tax=Roseomonas chloroacetimidivorans TaxID=1766656 RepID=UPI003C777BB6
MVRLDLLRMASPRSRALYAALRAARPEALPLLTLAQIVWPDGERPNDPIAALRMQVDRLRKRLEGAAADEDVEYVRREGAPPGWRLTFGTRRKARRLAVPSGADKE